MKPLIKSSGTLFILLLLGYTQVFAHIHRNDFSSITTEKRSHHFQAPIDQTSEINGDYFTEESKRNLLKTYTRVDFGSDFFYDHISAVYFFQRLETSSIIGESPSRFSLLTSPLFRVLRL